MRAVDPSLATWSTSKMALCWSRNTRTAAKSPDSTATKKGVVGSGSLTSIWLVALSATLQSPFGSTSPPARARATGAHGASGSTPLTNNNSAKACRLLATATLNRGAASCSRGRTLGSEANNRSAACSCLAFAAAPRACKTSGPTRSGLAGDTSAPVDTTGAAAFSGIVVVDSAIWPAPNAMAASTTSPRPAAAARVSTVSPSLVDEEMGKQPRATSRKALSKSPSRTARRIASNLRAADAAPMAHASLAVRPASSVASLSAPAPNNNEATAPSFALAALCRGLWPRASSAASKAFLAASSPACKATNVAAASYAPRAQATCSGVLLPPSLANAPALSRPGSVAHSRRQARTKVASASTASAAAAACNGETSDPWDAFLNARLRACAARGVPSSRTPRALGPRGRGAAAALDKAERGVCASLGSPTKSEVGAPALRAAHRAVA
mmetsp:Transcript_4597/g.11453  ORF Transcript_4597/g.11453 Transcript_4597/m.11453 type:complete len:443 (-) Transcript_4597:2509-3837(-)